MNDQAEKVDGDQRGQFRLASIAFSEAVRNFDDTETAAG